MKQKKGIFQLMGLLMNPLVLILIVIVLGLLFIPNIFKGREGLIITDVSTWYQYPDIDYKNITWEVRYTKADLGTYVEHLYNQPSQPSVSETSMFLKGGCKYNGRVSTRGVGMSLAVISKNFDWSKYDEVWIGWKYDGYMSVSAQFAGSSLSSRLEIGDKSIGIASGSTYPQYNTNIIIDKEGTFLFERNMNGGWDIYDVGRYIKKYLVTVEDIKPDEPLGFFTSNSWSLQGSFTSCSRYTLEIQNIQGVEKEVRCPVGTVRLLDDSCYPVVQTCIDNNKNGMCDEDDPLIWADANNPDIPICADRDGDSICDGVESLFCVDNNNNKICDSDELKWTLTHCEDRDSNGICDSVENDESRVFCTIEYEPVCDITTNITYPNQCIANSFGVSYVTSKCKVEPTIIRLDCVTGDVPIPTGYSCDTETGWLFLIEDMYQDVNLDCRLSNETQEQLGKGYICHNMFGRWIFTKEYIVNQFITCPAIPCPYKNQLCQNGICVEESKILRCDNDLFCKNRFGDNSACDVEVGLCVADKYIELTCADIEITCLEDETCETNLEGTRGRCVRTVLLDCPKGSFYSSEFVGCVTPEIDCKENGCVSGFACVEIDDVNVCKKTVDRCGFFCKIWRFIKNLF